MIKKTALGLALILAAFVAWVAVSTNHGYITTPSMYPTIPPGSLIFIHKEPTYHVGEVIEFHGGGLDYVHRIIKIAPNGDITTKGDNPQNAPDLFGSPITAADVEGVVYLAPKWLGFPELLIHHPEYGLSWLRAELGRRGDVGVAVVAGLIVFLWAGRTKDPESDDSDPPGDPAAPDITIGEYESDTGAEAPPRSDGAPALSGADS